MTTVAELLADQLKNRGVEPIFTLSGGHIFPLLDAIYKKGARLIDVRHEQSAAFAAEAVGKLSKSPGCALVTAGPGVTNTISALAASYKHGSPMILLAGCAPVSRWGQGSLQELDHIKIVESITLFSHSLKDPNMALKTFSEAYSLAQRPPRGPVFLDYPLDKLIAQVEILEGTEHETTEVGSEENHEEVLLHVLNQLFRSERPVIIAGSGIYLSSAYSELEKVASFYKIPIILNGLARGAISEHNLVVSLGRQQVLKNADLIIVAGTLLDFRLNFGKVNENQTLIHLIEHKSQENPKANATIVGCVNLASFFSNWSSNLDPKESNKFAPWLKDVSNIENNTRSSLEKTAELQPTFTAAQIYLETNKFLDKNSIVIGDGGDFVSWAGKLIQTHSPGSWIDSGPFGCLGSGIGYAIGAKSYKPEKDVFLFLGDGAIGFSIAEIDTCVRHNLGVVAVVGNNGIWGLEKHPMKAFFGYDILADLSQETDYVKIAQSFGADGITVDNKKGFKLALEKAIIAAREGKFFLINALIDPNDVYPRSSNLA